MQGSTQRECVLRKLLAAIPCFLEVARCASFTQAAENLGIPLATLSRRIAGLERDIGFRLFYRNNQMVGLTNAGKDLLESSRFIMDEVRDVQDKLIQKNFEPKGDIRLSIDAYMYQCFFRGAFGGFARKHPQIELRMLFTNAWQDLHRELFDLDIRSGSEFQYPDLKVRRLLSASPALYGAPEMLKEYPDIREPEHLAGLPFVSHRPERGGVLSCHREDLVYEVRTRLKHTVQSLDSKLEFLLAGQGISSLLPHIAEEFVQRKELVRLLPGWTLGEVDLYLFMPDAQVPKKIRLFIEHIQEHLRGLRQRMFSGVVD